MTADVRFGVSTHIGLVRDINEDTELHTPPLFAVADGMGGHRGGDVASAMAIEGLSAETTDLAGSIVEANAAIYERSLREAHLSGMGTTLTALRASAESVEIAHIGDSRAYLLKDHSLQQLTEDHTEVGRLVRQGRISRQEAARHPRRNYIERALGIFPEVRVDSLTIPASSGMRFLLCSDGLFGMIDDAQIAQILDEEADPQAAAEKLCAAAVEAGGADNVTAVVVDYGEGTPEGGTTSSPSAKQANPTSKRTARLVRIAVVAAIVLMAAGFAAKASIRNSWYVGADAEHVAIFNGMPASVAGIDLFQVRSTTGLATKDLPPIYQQRLRDGIRAADLRDAQQIVVNLKELSGAPIVPTETTGGSL